MPRSSGRRPHPLKLQRPLAPTPDSPVDANGEYVQEFETYQQLMGSVEPATASRLEKLTASGAIGAATDIVTIPLIEGVELKQRVLYRGRRLDIIGYGDPEERHIELVLICQEIKE